MGSVDIKHRIDRIWDAFWAAGISSSLEILEQISYLLAIRVLDEIIFPLEPRRTIDDESATSPSIPESLRWQNLINEQPARLLEIIRSEGPWLLRAQSNVSLPLLGQMEDVQFTIQNPGLLAKVVDLVR
jgi:hypothetical protein